MSDVGTWYGGATPSKAVKEYWLNGTIPWLSPKDMLGETVFTTEDHITESALKRASITLVPPKSIAIVVRSNILRRKLPTAYVPFATTLNQDIRAVAPRDGIVSKYLAYVVHANADRLLSASVRTDGSMAAVASRKLMDFTIPIPPLPEQQRIVEILDKFDALVNDLSIGLPAELKARRKQYEHYRDKLLTFEEAPA